jgi:hypothetical protein
MTVGRSAASTLVKSKRDCFMGFFLALVLPLGLAAGADSSVAMEYPKPAEKPSRGRGGSARPAVRGADGEVVWD